MLKGKRIKEPLMGGSKGRGKEHKWKTLLLRKVTTRL